MSIDRYSRSKQRSATAGAADQRRQPISSAKVRQPLLVTGSLKVPFLGLIP
jgi:hypothetical protein